MPTLPNGFQPATDAKTRRADFDLLRRVSQLEQALAVQIERTDYDGVWNGSPFIMGTYRLWLDGTGRLRVKNGAPSSITDGTVVGTQT